MKLLLSLLLFFIGPFGIQSQNLTISSTGETSTSGTNWSITGNTLNVASSGTADVHPNVISNHLNNVGNLTVVLPGQSNQIRNCSIDGTITYTGSATRTLTFLIANDIFITSPNQSITATGTGALNVVLRAANANGSPNNGRVSIRQNNTINTNGGHLWIGGGSGNVTWNGLTVGNDVARTWTDNIPGLWIENSTLNTNGGNVYLAGLSWNSSANSGENYGVRVVNSNISSVSGNIEINGELDGRYSIGNGTRIESTTTTATSITTTTGSISIRGTGSDNSPNDNGFRFGAIITGSSSTAKTIISSTSGNIQIEGTANFTATVNDKEGLGIGGSTEIISRSGNISLRGTNTLESSGQYCNSIRFDPRNESNSIRVGFDGTNSYTGNILIEGNSIYQRYLHSSTGSIAVQTTGTLTIQPTGTAFTYMRADNAGTLTYDNDWNFGTTLSSFSLGKSTNTTNLTFANVLSPAGPITIYGGNININENLNTSAGASSGNVLLKGSGDIVLAASKSITTSGAPVILWANSDNEATNGSIALRNGSSIVTGSGSVTGGHVWIGGGSNGTTWNGLSVGNGYAVPGTSFTPSNGGNVLSSGIYLERNTLNSFGGNIKIAGDGAASARGIVSYGNTININSGSGKIEMDGQVTSTAAGNRGGILFGLHENTIASTVDISSSAISGDAITITGVGRGTEDAIGLSGTLNITSSAGGNIVMNGKALGTGRSIVAGNYYHGIMNVFANSGTITLNGNSKAVQVATPVINGLTTGPSKLNIGQGGSISSSSSDITITGDQIAIAAGGIAVNSTGKLVVEPLNTSFNASVSWPITNFSVASGLTGLRLGKDGNTADITIASAQTIAGPIEVYGGNIAVNENLNTSAGNTNGDILFKATADIILESNKSITTNGGDVIFWANSDGQTSNGGVFFNAITNVTTSGGHIWIGGSSSANGSTSWNGLTVGNGYAVSGRDLAGFSTRTLWKVDWDAGILLNETTLNSGGGNIYLGGQRNVRTNYNGGAGIINYNGTNGTTINSGSGVIDIKAFGSHTADVTLGFLTGLHPGETSGNLTIQSSNANQTAAISIEANNASTNFAGLLIEDETNIISSNSTNGGGISITGITGGNSYGIWVQVGSLNTLSASGKITLDGGTKGIGLHVNSSFNNSSFQSISNTGHLFVGSRTGYAISTSIANIDILSDIIINNTGTSFNIASSGQLNILSKSNAFSQTLSSSQWNLSSNLSGLTIGKTTNTSNITFGSTTTIAGPITVYGGLLTLNENISSSNGSTISLFGNTLSFGTNKTVTSSNGQLVIAPQTASNTIGLGGAAGTLSLPASYFSTNFTDGFSNIQIGSNTQTGNIAANAFTLRDNMTFLTSGSLTLGGKPILGSNNVTLGNAISSISGTPTHYFQTNGSGKMITTLANNASRIFPLGNTYYNPVTITNNTGNSDTFSVRVIDSVSGNGDTGRQITTPHVKATWDISKNNANSGSGINMQFSWQSSQEIGGITNFVLNHHNGTIWEIAAGTTGSVSGTTTKTITHTGYTGSFSPFAFGNSVTPLPVELKSFIVACQSDYILLNWTTASEIRNQTFELYKSDNAIDWNLIHTTEGQGDKATETLYSFNDLDKKIGYYRLKDIDEDGIENWSQIIFSDCKANTSKTEIYPNPAADYIKVSTEMDDQSIMRILNLDGREVKTLPLISKQTLVDIRELTPGVYILEIDIRDLTERLKLIKQ